MKEPEEKESVADSLQELTETIESRKEEKRRKREAKIRAKEKKRKMNAIEKSVAPIILVLTILISFLFMMFSQ